MSQWGWRWPYKPVRGTRLDLSHPWVGPAGLQGFYALNESTGGIVGDATGQLPLAVNASSTLASWSGSGAMTGLNCVTRGAGASGLLPAGRRLGWPLTVACGFRYLGVPGTDTRLFYLTFTNDSVTSPYCAVGCHVAYNGDPYQIYNTAGTSVANPIGGPLTPGRDYVMVTTIGKSLQFSACYGSDGSVVSLSSSSALSNPTYGASPQVCIGEPAGSVGDVNAVPNYLLYWAGWWSSYFPSSVIAALGSSVNAVWRIYQPLGSVAWVLTPVPVMGGGSAGLAPLAAAALGSADSVGAAAPVLGLVDASATTVVLASASAGISLGGVEAASAGAFAVSALGHPLLTAVLAAGTGTSTVGIYSVFATDPRAARVVSLAVADPAALQTDPFACSVVSVAAGRVDPGVFQTDPHACVLLPFPGGV